MLILFFFKEGNTQVHFCHSMTLIYGENCWNLNSTKPITLTTLQVPYLEVKSLHFVWRSGTYRPIFKWVVKTWPQDLGVVSLTFCELSKIFSRNLCIAEFIVLLRISNWNFVHWMCAHSHALGTCTKFQLTILTINVICGIVYFCEIILESLWNFNQTTPRIPR